MIARRGGGPRHLSWRGQDLLEGYGGEGQPAEAPLSANVVLAPWPNRTRDGVFTVGGTEHRLDITEPGRNNAIHGLVADLDWTVTARSQDAVTLSVDPGARPGWPWSLHLEVTYRVSPRGLSAEFVLRNESVETAPAACGFHLYPSALGAPTDDCTIGVPRHTLLPLDGRRLPCGPEITDTEVLPEASTTLRGRLLDHCLHVTGGGMEGRGAVFTLRRPDGRGVLLETSQELRWFQVFTPSQEWDMPYPGRPGGRAVAVEPMTAPPDALTSGTDLAHLAPGDDLTCSWSLRVTDD